MNDDLTQANALYKQSQKFSGVSRALKRGHLEKALRLYQGQLGLTRNDMDRSALLRNIAMTNYRLAEIVDEMNKISEMNLVVHYLKEAISNFKKALEFRPGSYGSEWGDGILTRISECFDVGYSRIGCTVEEVEKTRKYLNFLDTLFKELPDNSHFRVPTARSYFNKSQFAYNCSMNCLERTDFRSAAQFLEYAREAVELGKQQFASGNIKDDELLHDLDLMLQDIFIYSCCCESVRVRHQADQLFEEYVNNTEELNVDMMWEILDMYKDAALKTEEKDVENEALALSRMGRMFEKIFSRQSKGHTYYRRAFDLAQTLLPRDLNKLAWFIECKGGIERYQMRIVGEEAWKEEQEKKPILIKLKDELAELKKIGELNDPYKLLPFVYTKYPPKVPCTFVEKDLDSSTLKSFLRKASIHYHPDKQVEFGLEWKVMCEEISKWVNARYSNMKGCEP